MIFYATQFTKPNPGRSRPHSLPLMSQPLKQTAAASHSLSPYGRIEPAAVTVLGYSVLPCPTRLVGGERGRGSF